MKGHRTRDLCGKGLRPIYVQECGFLWFSNGFQGKWRVPIRQRRSFQPCQGVLMKGKGKNYVNEGFFMGDRGIETEVRDRKSVV